MKERRVEPTADHRTFRQELLELLDKHAGKLTALDMLAISSHLVGQVLAVQDARVVTREIALQTVMRNIEAGNAEALSELCHPLERR